MLKHFLVAALCFLLIIAVADVAGVILVTVLDILFNRFKSGALFYTVWLVAAIFAGTFYMALCLDKTRSDSHPKGNQFIAIVSALIMSVTCILIFHQLGEMSVTAPDNDYYVPGHRYVTYIFFIAFVMTAFLVRNLGVEKASKK